MSRQPRPALWGLAFTALYLATGARTVQWADASKLTLYALDGYAPSLNPGDHPGWTMLAWLWCRAFPDDPVIACHRFSALVGGLGVALLVALLRLWGKPPEAIRATAVLWGIAHGPWWSATVTETYTLAFALALGALLARGKNHPFVSGLLAGWAAAVHGLTLFLTLPALVSRDRWGAQAAGLVLGSSPVWLALRLPPRPDPLTGYLSSGLGALGWHVGSFLSPSGLAVGVLLLASLVAWNLGPLGLWAWWRTPPGGRRTLWTLVPLAFFLSVYAPFRLHVMAGFLILTLLLWRPPSLAKVGLAAHVGLQVALYLLTPRLLATAGWEHMAVRRLPFRNNARYFLNPIKRDDEGAITYALSVFSQAPPAAVIVADFNPGAVLKLVQQTKRLRPDVTVLPTVVDTCLPAPKPAACLAESIRRVLEEGRPVLLADTYEPYYHTRELEDMGFTLTPNGNGTSTVGGMWRADRDSNPEPSDP